MAPVLLHGDRLLVLGAARVGVGDIVAFADPEGSGLVLVKRVVAADAAGVEVAGDNREASRDSRQFGPVPRRALLGRAVYRYHPAGRVGRLGGARAGAGARAADDDDGDADNGDDDGGADEDAGADTGRRGR
jgi:signal peptidase I